MPIYIIRPKKNIVTQSLSLINRKFTLECRQKQTQEVIDVYQNDPIYQEMIHWAKHEGQKESIKIIKDPQQPNITGTMIVEMSAEDAENTKLDLKDHSILKNQPIDLIAPVRVTASHKTEDNLTEEDLWHLNTCNLKSKPQFTGNGVTIAVLDTGIDASHPALQGKIIQACQINIQKNGVDTLVNSFDTDGHGTHVAGLICGDRIGVAPDAKVINVLMIPNGKGDEVNFILALEWIATQSDIRIANISAGIRGYNSEMQGVIENLLMAGILPICAVGNEGRNQTRSPGNYSNVISVGATNKNDKVASFSSSANLIVDQHNYNVPDLVAPGHQVYSCVMTGGYEAWDGTSMATPIVSGIAALIIEENPNIGVLDLKEELFNRCHPLQQEAIRQGRGLIKF